MLTRLLVDASGTDLEDKHTWNIKRYGHDDSIVVVGDQYVLQWACSGGECNTCNNEELGVMQHDVRMFWCYESWK
jgi:hypothetical protein